MTITLRGLTLVRPWDYAIAHGPKRIENRGSHWRSIKGKLVAIHAGQRWDAQNAPGIAALCGIELSELRRISEQQKGTIRCVARVADVFLYEEDHPPHRDDVWASGPYCYQLDQVVRAFERIECKGRQGLFVLPPSVELRCRWLWDGEHGSGA